MIEAMKQALEALECYAPKVGGAAITSLRQAIAEAEKQEPVAQCMVHGECFGGKCIYQQPNHEWVGLTENEIDEIWNKYCDEMGEASINDAEDIAKAIEAKLKDKNA
jgi:hypothetical protein